LPPWLSTFPPIAERFEKLGVFKNTKHGAANHCLVNEYNAGEGIMPHEDGGAYSPVVATVSLGGTVCLDVYEKTEHDRTVDKAAAATSAVDGRDEEKNARSKPRWRILQPPRSLLVTMDPAYTFTIHGISPIAIDEDLGPETVANWELLEEDVRKSIMDNGGSSTRGLRISLTYREVLKVNKAVSAIFGKR